jgi:GTP-binding protein
VVRKELRAYGGGLAGKTEIIAFNKVDAVLEDELAKKLADFRRRIRKTPVLISAVTGRNVPETMQTLLRIVSGERAAESTLADAPEERWRP